MEAMVHRNFVDVPINGMVIPFFISISIRCGTSARRTMARGPGSVQHQVPSHADPDPRSLQLMGFLVVWISPGFLNGGAPGHDRVQLVRV